MYASIAQDHYNISSGKKKFQTINNQIQMLKEKPLPVSLVLGPVQGSWHFPTKAQAEIPHERLAIHQGHLQDRGSGGTGWPLDSCCLICSF